MLALYEAKGYSPEDAQALVAIQSQRQDLWVDAMMVQELGLLPDDRQPVLSAVATFAAFLLAGAIPLLTYLAGLFVAIEPETAFALSIALSGLALFALGAAKVLITERSWWRSGLEMLVVGGLAAGVAYLVGFLLQGLVG
jgi:VIT1/CCC1 family predicted Fe2+/Mn2+ transporter